MSHRPKLADELASLEGLAGLPRDNGEIVFDEPWQARAFGIAVAMNQQGLYPWESFRKRLIAAVSRSESDDGSGYYRRWLAALEDLVVSRQILDQASIEARMAEIAAADRHDDHDHDHDHDH